jgi:NAD(P)-dependent dehydrogenase (short-subunit alcohol dehydrogenase family)
MTSSRTASRSGRLRLHHQLDLSSLAAVHDSAKRLHGQYEHLDLLVNNAGGFRRYHSVTDDGLEATIAVNHFGPFAFTGLVLDLLTSRPGSRVVTVGSNGYQAGKIDLAAMRPDVSTVPDRSYSWIAAYCQAKLANLLFFYALDRRFRAAGVPTISVAGHPGLARTEAGGK